MKRYLLVFLFLLAAHSVFAQSTTVSGTITDQGGVLWKNGTYSFSFQPAASNPTAQYLWNGAPFNKAQTISGNLDNSASFSVSIPSNTSINPSGSTWLFQVCSAATASSNGCFTSSVMISGATQSLSALIPPAVVVNLQNPPVGASAYVDAEITGARTGSSYFNFTDNTIHVCINFPCTWISINTGVSILPSNNVFTGTNDFTNTTFFDADSHNKGPNPWADCTRFGCYFGPQTPPSTTGAIASGLNVLTMAAAQDFLNGHGILVSGAGPTTTLSTPTGVQAAPWGVTGSTRYDYCVIAEDYAQGRTACSAAGNSTTSAATLGVNTVALLSCNRASGLTTCTTTGNHNFTAGAQGNIVKNSTSDSRFEGEFSIFSTPTPTTFTYTQYGAADATATGGSAQVNATNLVKWNSDAAGTVLKWHVYRCSGACALPANAANYALVGTVVGVDGYFQDYNLALAVANNGNGDVPATAPTAASKDWLSSTILSGGGTTSLTLANNASTTVAGAKVLHDNTPNLVAACTSFTRGGIVYIPTSNVAANYFPINSPFKFSSCVNGGIQLQVANKIFANAPIIMTTYDNIQGLPGGRDSSVASPTFYDLRPHALITGFGYPLIYIPATIVNSSIDDIDFVCNQTYMPCIYHDQLTTGGSATGIRFRHVHANSGSGSNTPWVVKGGFGIFWEYGGWANAATSFASPPGMLFSPNCGLQNTNQQQAYLVTTQYTYGMDGTVFDNCNQPSLQGLNNFSFRDMLGESGRVPMFRFANTGGVGAFNGNPSWWEFVRTNYADSLGGSATPVIDATMVNQITGLHVVSPGAPQGPIIETNSGGVTGLDVSADFAGIVGAQFYAIPGAGNFANIPANASGSLGHFAYRMALPSPVQSAVVSAGGAVPLTGGIGNGPTHTYTVTSVDFSGNETTISTVVTATVSGGNQTVTLTHPATFPVGAKGINEYRDGFRINNGSCGTNPQFTTPGGTFADTSASTCGNSAPSVNAAGSAMVDSTGLSGNLLTFTNNIRFKSTLTAGTLTADRAATMPDAGGVVVIDTATQTLSGKTLTSPTINTPTVSNPTVSTGTFTSPVLVTPSIGSSGSTLNFVKISIADTPGAITVNANTCTDRTVAVAGLLAGALIIPTANYALDAGIFPSPGQSAAGNAHYRICNATVANVTLNAAATFNLGIIQ